MRRATILFLFPLALSAQFRRIAIPAVSTAEVATPIYAGGADYVSDLLGTPDKQFGGTSGYADTVLTFNPPAGYRVRILSADVTVSSFARGAVPVGTHSGVSWGLVTTNPKNSGRADLINDHCLSYIKQSISASKDTDTTTAHYDIQNGVLEPDNKLISRNAVYLNDTGIIIHTEVALILTYTFEPITGSSQQ